MFNDSDKLKLKIDSQKEELAALYKTADSVLQMLDIKNFIQAFNSRNEEIFSIVIHNGKPFVITIELKYSSIHDGLLSEINFYGYIVESPSSLYRDNDLYAEINYNNLHTKIESVFLIDNTGHSRNQGYGSLMMKAFLAYIKKLRVTKVIGKLSWVDTQDPTHEKLLHHFYTKFGFKLLPENRIQLDIKY